ncbi:hypothetical protein HGH93_23520 [Chitinophaga polysaccharea]|uniref:hypothetical protein n=1 Tax=Chitinophaga polysaccharea TaxID=1293035 RepID=UPI001454E494|nr:hypothetical protein [Chitinophaga polysaccharea]NLR61091.1 hypothetical protein [Chitinophaga polysaccharea]
MTEREYRAIGRLSYSSVKQFLDNRWEYYEKHELKIKKLEEQTYDMAFGTLVETRLWTEQAFGELFVEAQTDKPGGQMGELVEKLYTYTTKCLTPEGIVTRDFTDLLTDAFNAVAFDSKGVKVKFKKKTIEDIILAFTGSEYEKYYREMLENTGKYLVGQADIKLADNCKNYLAKHWRTGDIVTRKTNGRYTVYHQLVILYEYLGVEFKSKLDMVSIDDELKLIEIFDLKITFDVELFNFSYRKFKYYLQAYLYYIAIKRWAQENGLGHYKIAPMKFIVGHSRAEIAPLVFKIRQGNMINARDGFNFDGKRYTGVNEAVEAIKWHRQTNIWDMSKKNFENKGDCNIKIYEDEQMETNKHNVVSGSYSGTRHHASN